MPVLEVPGAGLSYRRTGSGPTLLLIPGAGGSGLAFVRVAKRLAAHYSVVRYARRGFSRSHLDQPPDRGSRLAADADDAAGLIEHLGGRPAAVLGESSGALVALELLTRHPDSVRTVVPFEPPAMRLLPDAQQWIDIFDRVHDTYHHHGMRSALKLFRERTFAESDRKAMRRGVWLQLVTPSIRASFAHWLDYELRQYPATPLDLTALRAHRAKIIPAVGRESRGYPCYRATAELARQLDLPIAEFPGGHLAHITEPAAFARSLVRTLASTL
ncbi:alpha/beta fold hydrolase [Actinocrispum wychmicini]|uniref:Pimeloyl-ACP methyl ester carboxylesterase n=1 Tax=Actinocrispum wychmicini TaxID=1213861 RepID=A0A4R2JK41_9PSEU|nr:alpha/beta hydrolase [Actinocrispum wychmicini]TCO59514.1 pimeloyl-ACP methyl ester carboxylesterase [Actinocrispum wychmicini]